ncbi:MAG: bifunctional folylpolyglutamate synthase/dihydrofolate synthase [Oscillatoriales cyanobacterium]|nr:MAG: bifunctional folylpolyglutamate synthase/dihydrofolate synthase [Oscillatoriales cyanobacterium]
MLALLDRLGNPHHRIPIVHVAGTNGKGSVCAAIASVLRAAGYRVGRYTSPHLVRWNERVCVDGQPLGSDRLLAAIEQTITAIAREPEAPTPTQFEVLTAAAWVAFAAEAVDIAVIEVGLGGRLDATNVCDHPLVSAIVSIGRDHWQRLGDSLAAIAGEKAGILKRDRPAVVGVLPEEARAVVAEKIAALTCPTIWAEPAQWTTPTPAEADRHSAQPIAQWRDLRYPLPLLGDFQLQNSAVAMAAIVQLRSQGWTIPDAAIWEGMEQVRWPGRMEWLRWGDRVFLLDGAHNVEAAERLRVYVDRVVPAYPDRSIHWVIAMLAVKDLSGVLTALLRPGDRLFAFAVEGHSSATAEELVTIATQVCPQAITIACEDLTTALDQALKLGEAPDHLTVFCGSLYAIGNAYRDLPLEPVAPPVTSPRSPSPSV